MNNGKNTKIEVIDSVEKVLRDINEGYKKIKLTGKMQDLEKEIKLLQLELKRQRDYIKTLSEEIILMKLRSIR